MWCREIQSEQQGNADEGATRRLTREGCGHAADLWPAVFAWSASNLLGASRAFCAATPMPQSEAYITNTLKKLPDVGQKFEYLLNTGNLVSKSGLDLSQATGFTVRAGKGVPTG